MKTTLLTTITMLILIPIMAYGTPSYEDTTIFEYYHSKKISPDIGTEVLLKNIQVESENGTILLTTNKDILNLFELTQKYTLETETLLFDMNTLESTKNITETILLDNSINTLKLTDDEKDTLELLFLESDPFFDLEDPEYLNDDGTINFPDSGMIKIHYLWSEEKLHEQMDELKETHKKQIDGLLDNLEYFDEQNRMLGDEIEALNIIIELLETDIEILNIENFIERDIDSPEITDDEIFNNEMDRLDKQIFNTEIFIETIQNLRDDEIIQDHEINKIIKFINDNPDILGPQLASTNEFLEAAKNIFNDEWNENINEITELRIENAVDNIEQKYSIEEKTKKTIYEFMYPDMTYNQIMELQEFYEVAEIEGFEIVGLTDDERLAMIPDDFFYEDLSVNKGRMITDQEIEQFIKDDSEETTIIIKIHFDEDGNITFPETDRVDLLQNVELANKLSDTIRENNPDTSISFIGLEEFPNTIFKLVDSNPTQDTYRLPDMVITANVDTVDDYTIAYNKFFTETENEKNREYWDNFDKDGFFSNDLSSPPIFSQPSTSQKLGLNLPYMSTWDFATGDMFGLTKVGFTYNHIPDGFYLSPKDNWIWGTPHPNEGITNALKADYMNLLWPVGSEEGLGREYDSQAIMQNYGHVNHAYHINTMVGGKSGLLENPITDMYWLGVKIDKAMEKGTISNDDKKIYIETMLAIKKQIEENLAYVTAEKYTWSYTTQTPDYRDLGSHGQRSVKNQGATLYECQHWIEPGQFDFITSYEVNTILSQYYWKEPANGKCFKIQEYRDVILLGKSLQWYERMLDKIVELNSLPTKITQIEKCDTVFLAKTANWEKLEECTQGKANVWNDQARIELGKDPLSNPESDAGKAGLGYQLFNEGKHRVSLSVYEDLERTNAGEPQIKMMKGNNYSEMGNVPYAVTNYYQAGLDSAVAVNGIAMENWKIGNYQTAFEFWQKAISLDNDLADAYNGLGMYYRVHGDYDKAEIMYNYVLENLNPEHPDSLGGLSLIP